MNQSSAGSSPLDRFLAACLVVGSLLLAASAAFHPALPPDAADQLQVMGGTRHWRTIHLAMLVGSALLVTGIWLRVAIDHSGRRPQLWVALALIAAGIGLVSDNLASFIGTYRPPAARLRTRLSLRATHYSQIHEGVHYASCGCRELVGLRSGSPRSCRACAFVVLANNCGHRQPARTTCERHPLRL